MVSFLIIVLFRKDPKLFPKFFDCKFKGSSNEPRKSVAVIWKLNCGYLNSCNVFLFRKLLKHHHRTYHADVPIPPENVRTLEVFKVENIYMEKWRETGWIQQPQRKVQLYRNIYFYEEMQYKYQFDKTKFVKKRLRSQSQGCSLVGMVVIDSHLPHLNQKHSNHTRNLFKQSFKRSGY